MVVRVGLTCWNWMRSRRQVPHAADEGSQGAIAFLPCPAPELPADHRLEIDLGKPLPLSLLQ